MGSIGRAKIRDHQPAVRRPHNPGVVCRDRGVVVQPSRWDDCPAEHKPPGRDLDPSRWVLVRDKHEPLTNSACLLRWRLHFLTRCLGCKTTARQIGHHLLGHLPLLLLQVTQHFLLTIHRLLQLRSLKSVHALLPSPTSLISRAANRFTSSCLSTFMSISVPSSTGSAEWADATRAADG
jgi:hypothetical protein